MTRPVVASLALAAVAALVLWDAAAQGLPEPFRFPAAIALGSGAAPTGAHCTAN
ncbi:hypothetical protein [Pararhodobacter zhoushanensis]|uniref:Uncharacterized protein n=1 Tax=Pararhodobacter zhoushanensis TaxID=2479545 RepID=A0ABT3H2U2_9RHOB|nr:hypothetical protein [Pararhodobacter zhoushanensis]MCW1934018.1 hypothetical protein [Pararhodobacter zhoushanensis]